MESEKSTDKLEELIPYFSKVYFFNKLHRLREYTVVSPHGLKANTAKRNDNLELGAEEFSLLWLIDTLSNHKQTKTHLEIPHPTDSKSISVNGCEQGKVKQVYFWRKPVEKKSAEKKYGNRFRNLLDTLKSVGFIRTYKHRGKTFEYLTEEGINCLKDLREERRIELEKILKLAKIESEQLDKIVEIFKNLSEETMSVILKESLIKSK